jgi:hypothetical protein
VYAFLKFGGRGRARDEEVADSIVHALIVGPKVGGSVDGQSLVLAVQVELLLDALASVECIVDELLWVGFFGPGSVLLLRVKTVACQTGGFRGLARVMQKTANNQPYLFEIDAEYLGKQFLFGRFRVTQHQDAEFGTCSQELGRG